MKVLGIETSCDETGVAIFDTEKNTIVSEQLYSQAAKHALYGGVVPELASRDHLKKLIPLIRLTVQESGYLLSEIDGIAYTAGPGLRGPLLIGASAAKAIALSLGKPSIGIHHMEAHLLINLLESPAPSFPFLTLLISGGHCLLINSRSLGDYEIIGQTLDDAVGEAFDKVAKILELGYPGGPKIEELAKTTPLLKEVKTITEKTNLVKNITEVPKISSQGSIMNLQDLINQESQVLDSNILENDINKYSSLIINLIEAAWIKPKNIQNNLICDIKIKINPRGRIVDISLINSSGNIRFDNSALQAVRRVETFSFFNEITKKTYEDVFKNIVISFNPS